MINSFKRREKKFLITQEQYEALLPTILEHMNYDKFCIGGNRYLIRNIYLDTDTNTLIRISTSKPKFKEKIRIRKYGTWNDGRDEYFLEIKRKINKIVTKRRIKLTYAQLNDFLNNNIKPEKHKALNKQIVNELEYFLSLYKVKNKAFLYYERLAFFDKEDPNFRVSFDTNIRSRRNSFDFDDSSYEKELINDNQLLMEVKINNAFPLWFTKELSRLKIYSGSFSKYGTDFKQSVKKGEFTYENI
ncbi:MAG: polyphosphate polymerase domain-containing protein [Bacilli bacterium]